MRYRLLDDELLDEVENLDREDQAQYLFLVPSEDFRGRWSITSLWPDWFLDFEDIVGRYRTVAPARLDEFLSHAEDGGYPVVFSDPPEDILDEFERLSDPPPFELNSTLDNTVHGMLPWQIQGFNKLVLDESLKAGLVVWDTGTGKTAFIASAIRYHLDLPESHPFNLALVVVKKNNKVDTQRKLEQLGGIQSHVVQGPPKQRDKVYELVFENLENGMAQVVIANYESFRQDDEMFKALIEGRDCLFFWDEMPTRLSNRTTQLYEAIQHSVWKKFRTRKEGFAGAVPRAKWMRQWELSATPIENSPDGLFSCIRVMDPALLGAVHDFHNDYVSYHNPISRAPEKWMNLDKLDATIEFMTHRASMDDPEIAAMFPEVMEDPLVIDWDSRDRSIYDMLAKKAAKSVDDEEDEVNILALIQVMQMICDAPSMINQSAKNRKTWEKMIEEDEAWLKLNPVKGSDIAMGLIAQLGRELVDDHHTKFDTLREILIEKHPNDKALVYMTWAGYGFEPISAKLKEWGVSYVAYTGTDKQRQHAKDSFRSDPNIRVFLSSDKGSDSIDLPEAAVGVNYNLPWTWTRKRQRQGRNNRVDSSLATNWWYDLLMANSVELRKRDIIATKQGFHTQIFDGMAHDDSVSTKLSREDLMFILTGER